ncbi:ribosomal protein L6 [Desulfonatronospira thiodismutans ASO3-1]|uniref:Large ribosomal subunit protein uL6 n=1 Tax=Desulfonatronospira thiodismutans ASO3-1 TaxID=555779 RepID=D6SUL8_9BACT|nr:MULTISPECIES: 50S ribosomal protein L6 [Desulfonatronospira]EFI32998.1 ribosomal protein L6 [Desulfonatronospira thiodismutans ASO3-1]RQD74531.1 MAG: 50S ribosomal protein L6 [Desulfonatronospira sp. MSAO_Bac3]
MSRIGIEPIKIPQGVEITQHSSMIDVKGPKGQLSVDLDPRISINIEGQTLQVQKADDSIKAREQWGLRRTLINNAVQGVHQGFKKSLDVIGVGYKVDLQGNTLVLNVGYSHPVHIELPGGVEGSVEKNRITLSGIDKQLVGETAAKIRRVRPPEPYKGKGIRYENEEVKQKAGKSGKK